MDSKVKDRMRPDIPQEDLDRIYRMQQRTYWEIDFIDRCVDRRMEGTGLCNIPYETLADESVILDTAYELYCRWKDSNIAYNVTLDIVIDEIEKRIANDMSEVLEQVERYFAESLPKYKVLKIRRKSYHPDDDYLYMVTAKKDDGTYAVWTSWNQSTKSLNCGHYNLPDEKVCEEIMNEYYFSGDPK